MIADFESSNQREPCINTGYKMYIINPIFVPVKVRDHRLKWYTIVTKSVLINIV